MALRPYDRERRAAQQNQCELPCFIVVAVAMILAERTIIMQNILKAFGGAGINCVDEVRVDYCHIEALVIITLTTELIGSL